MAGEIEKPQEETSDVVVERKVFVFKELSDSEKEDEASTSVAVSEGTAEETKEGSEENE